MTNLSVSSLSEIYTRTQIPVIPVNFNLTFFISRLRCFSFFVFFFDVFVFASLQHIFFFGLSIYKDKSTTISCGFEVFSCFFFQFYITYPKFTGTYVETYVRYRAIIKLWNIMFLINKQGHINDVLINIKLIIIIIIIIYGGHPNYGFEFK